MMVDLPLPDGAENMSSFDIVGGGFRYFVVSFFLL